MAATEQEKAFCVLDYAQCKSVTTVQRNFRRRFGKDPPTRKSIYNWHRKFETTGCLCKGKSPGRPCISEENVQRIRRAFLRIPKKSIPKASRELQIPQTTVCKDSMFHVESEPEENFVKQEPGECVENTKKLATEESRQHFEYVDVTSIKKEADYIIKEEPEESFENLFFETVKEEAEDEISIQENEVCLGDAEGNNLYDDKSVNQEDTPGHHNDLPASARKCKTQFCKCEACSSISAKHLSCSRNSSQTQPYECDPGNYSVLQGRGNVGMKIQFSKMDTQICQISDNEYMKIHKKTDACLHKKKEAQERRLSEEKTRMLQKKRDSERKRYSQMVSEEKERMLQKRRDSERKRYSQLVGEEKARLLQKNRDAKRNRYRQMVGEAKAKFLQKKRDAKRNRYSQMSGEEKARVLQKNRDAKRNKYRQMTGEEKARILQKNRDAKRNKYRQMVGEEKVKILQKKRDAKRNRYNQMTAEEKARILQKNRDTKRNIYSQMTCEEKAVMLQKRKEARQMRLSEMEHYRKARVTRKKKGQSSENQGRNRDAKEKDVLSEISTLK